LNTSLYISKAIFADFFTETESQAAFANIILQSGSASTVAFFVFPGLSPGLKAATLLATSASGFICYVFADRLNAYASKKSENYEGAPAHHDHEVAQYTLFQGQSS